jgi:hypothetical protein
MNEHKRGRADLVGKPLRSEFSEKVPLRSEATMNTDPQLRKSGGRLSREDQRRLGDILQRAYDDVVSQGVPDRFRELLSELDEPRQNEAAEPGTSKLGRGDEEMEPDSLLGVKADNNPGTRGTG